MPFKNGRDLNLIEFTLEAKDGKELSDGMDRFVELSAKPLRSCDVILRYNSTQAVFLILEPENGDFMIPVNRVLDAWKSEGDSDVAVIFKHEKVNET